MNKSNLILASVSAIIFTSILIIFSPTSKKPSPSSPTPIPTTVELISPTPDPTADWKTYTNNRWGYSFKYPSNWFLNNDIVSEYPWPFDGYFDPKYNYQQIYNAIEAYVYPNQVWSDMTNSAFFDSLSRININETGDVGKNKGKKIFTGTTQDNFTYEIFEINALEKDEPYIGVEAYILNNQKLAKVILTSYNQEGISLLNQILSTFKFIDPTADWKIYENNDYGFSIKYPANLTIESTTKEKLIRLLSQENIKFPGGNVTAFWIKDNLSISDYIQNTKNFLSPLNLENTLKQNSFTINGVDFIKLSYTDAMGDREEYVTSIKNNVFIFSGDFQILSTFKFTQ